MKAHERYNMNLTSFQFVCQASVTGAPQQVLTALLSHCYSKGECFPSVKRLAIIAGVSVRTIHRALNCLKELGIITIIHRFNKEGKKCSNLYILNGLQERLDQSGTKENRQGICHGGIYKSSSERAKKTYDTNSEQKDSGFALQNEYEILEISDSKKSKAKQPTAEAPKAKENATRTAKAKKTIREASSIISHWFDGVFLLIWFWRQSNLSNWIKRKKPTSRFLAVER